jgi:hypothetical protein
MDELERYLARRTRRRLFAITIRDSAEPDLWARLKFEDKPLAYVFVNGGIGMASLPNDPNPRMRPHLSLEVDGSLDARLAGPVGRASLEDLAARGLADFANRMADAGWTEPHGYSDRGAQHYWFQRQRPPDTPATLAAIAREAAAALLGTDDYVLKIEPFQGVSPNVIGEAAGYRFLSTTAGFVVTAPIVAILVALLTRSPLVAALVAGALVAIASLYLILHPGRDSARWRPSFELDLVLLRLQIAVGESAVVELPIVGPLVERVLSMAVTLVGVWIPIVVAIVITSAARGLFRGWRS